jgi:phage gpG-like protein
MSFQLQSNIGQLNRELERKAKKLVSDTAFNLQTRMRQSMAEAKHGRRYGKHIASAPGESPAIDTGFLANSLQVAEEGLTAYVGTNAEYAEVLEFGGARMEPRPYFEPAFTDEAPTFEQGVKDLLT